MTAFGIGWGIFWLLIWSFVVIFGLMPPHNKDDAAFIATGLVGCAVSVAWIFAFSIARVLS